MIESSAILSRRSAGLMNIRAIPDSDSSIRLVKKRSF